MILGETENSALPFELILVSLLDIVSGSDILAQLRDFCADTLQRARIALPRSGSVT
jgi:hypothetical protein